MGSAKFLLNSKECLEKGNPSGALRAARDAVKEAERESRVSQFVALVNLAVCGKAWRAFLKGLTRPLTFDDLLTLTSISGDVVPEVGSALKRAIEVGLELNKDEDLRRQFQDSVERLLEWARIEGPSRHCLWLCRVISGSRDFAPRVKVGLFETAIKLFADNDMLGAVHEVEGMKYRAQSEFEPSGDQSGS